jgi:tetratricopeptide (TPR) repeat protein
MTLVHKFDVLAVLTKAALAALTAVMLLMLVQHEIAARCSEEVSPRSGGEELQRLQQRAEADKKIYAEVAALFEQRQFAQAADKLKAAQALHPGNPRSLLWQARLQYETDTTVNAIASYRKAIDAEPGFLDKKSPLFELAVIKQLKLRVDESKDKLRREMGLKPGDSSLKQAFNDLLYLQRRIAGGCE